VVVILKILPPAAVSVVVLAVAALEQPGRLQKTRKTG
jgi:hypothetical protein